jgi:hypothetical protein
MQLAGRRRAGRDQDVTVTQGNVTGSSGTASMTVRNGTDTEWWLDVNLSNQFTPARRRPKPLRS